MYGLQDNNILACAKHFPGHGDTETDSHLSLPVIHHSRERLDSIEFFPFKSLVDNGLGSIMVGHINLPKIDSSNIPSTFSKKIIFDILKQQLGFKGIVISDALNMNALSNYNIAGERELNAFLAGNDILLFPKNIPQAIDLIRQEVNKYPLLEKQLNYSCKKILMLKKWAHVFREESFDYNSSLQSPVSKDLNRRLTHNAITLLKNRDTLLNKEVLPLRRLDSLKIASLSMGPSSGEVFSSRLNDYLTISNYIYILIQKMYYLRKCQIMML